MIELIYTVFLGILLGCVSAFGIRCADKWNWLTWYDMHRKLWMPERCEFCLGFWVSCILFAALFLLNGERFEYIYLASIPVATIVNIKGIYENN